MSQLPSLNEAEAAVLRIIRDAGGEMHEDDLEEKYGDGLHYMVPLTQVYLKNLTNDVGDLRVEITESGRLALAQWEEKQKNATNT